VDGYIRSEDHQAPGGILVDSHGHVHHPAQEDSQGREVFGAHGPQVGHLQFVDYVLAGYISHQADAGEALNQDGVLDRGLLLQNDLDDLLIHED